MKGKKYYYTFLALCAAVLLAFNLFDEDYLVFQYFKYIQSINVDIDGKNYQLNNNFAVYENEDETYILKSSSDLRIKFALRSNKKLDYDLNEGIRKGVLTKTNIGNEQCKVYKYSNLFSDGPDNYLVYYMGSEIILDIVNEIGAQVDFGLACDLIN